MKLFVWDFHGVLEKNNEKAVWVITNQILSDFGYKKRMTRAENDKYLGLKWYQYFENLLPEISKEKCLELQSACFKYSDDDDNKLIEKHIRTNDHAIEVLKKIQKSGNQQLLLSNTRPDYIIWYLKTVGIYDYFDNDKVIGVNAHQTHKSKVDALKEHLIDKKFDKIISIGDSESDLELGKAFKATTYYYRHPNRKHEESEKADYIINDLREILKEL